MLQKKKYMCKLFKRELIVFYLDLNVINSCYLYFSFQNRHPDLPKKPIAPVLLFVIDNMHLKNNFPDLVRLV